MSTNSVAKRCRATNEQLSQMVDFMMCTPHFIGGKFQKLHGSVEYKKKWNEMAEMLNCLDGAVKTVEQWRTVWRDLKSRTSLKMKNRKRQQEFAVKEEICEEPITELEKRVITIIESEFIEAQNSVFENVPIKEEQQLLIEDGDEFMNDIPPSPTMTENSYELLCNPSSNPKRESIRAHKRKLVVEENDTKKRFLEIADKQAESLKMLAESSVVSVEAAKNQAEALKILGECSAANLKISKMIAEALTTMGESLRATSDVLNKCANTLNKCANALNRQS